MIAYVSPGLPSFPVLQWDPERRLAKVSIRHANWRSHEWAFMWSKLIAMLVLLVATIAVWNKTVGYELLARIVVTGLFLAIFGRLLVLFVRRSLQGFLARRFFPSRGTFWFSRKGVGIKSDLFPSGFVIWRRWKGLPVTSQFSIASDPGAIERRQEAANREPFDRMHLDTARILRLILSTETRATANQAGRVHPVRAIPICEIDEQVAERVCIVLSTAAALTSALDVDASRQQRAIGRDIDQAGR
ncbi:hypothetical protein Mal65_11200 [Crateriforma conspicua]|nr:hypothetical protein Mal65_11200 [Crateriforma conspicua]